MTSFFWQIILVSSVLVENILGFKFVEMIILRDGKLLRNKELNLIYVIVFIVSMIEFYNKSKVFYFSIVIMIFKIIIIAGIICYLRKKQVIVIFCVLITYFTIVQSVDFIIGFFLATKILGEPHFFEIYLEDGVMVRNISALLLRIAILYVYNKGKQLDIKISNKKILVILTAIAYGSMMYFYSKFLDGITCTKIDNLYLQVLIIILILMVFLIYSQHNAYYEKNKIISEQNLMLENNAKNLYGLFKRNRYLSHDLKNHLDILENFLVHNQGEKAKNYLLKIKEPIDKMECYIDSGNAVVDTILNYKIQAALNENIQIMHEIDAIGKIPIEDEDICIMIANLMDNAIEANQEIVDSEKWIDITLRNKNNMFILQIENPYRHERALINGRYKTSKENSQNHGIGLESVEFILSKYDGDLMIDTKNGIFCSNIVLFL